MPFPVTPEYRIRADVTPLDGPHTIRDRQAESYALAKHDRLERAPELHRALAARADTHGVRRALVRFAEIAAGEQRLMRDLAEMIGPPPREAGDRDQGTPSRGDVLAYADRLALSLQEDFVVMRAGLGAELLHVCFPSHWDPGAHAGSHLSALHGPVPHGDRLQAASDNLLRAMISKGPFERWVWSVNSSGKLSQHPAERRSSPTSDALVEQLWFRVERQTTMPMPDIDRSVFMIRIFQAPLADVLNVEPGRAARLAAAVSSMDPALRRYKGLGEMGERLCRELAEFA